MKLNKSDKKTIVNDIKNEINNLNFDDVRKNVMTYSQNSDLTYSLKRTMLGVKTIMFIVAVFVLCTITSTVLLMNKNGETSDGFDLEGPTNEITFKDFCDNTNICEMFISEFLTKEENFNPSGELEIELTVRQKEIINYTYFLTQVEGVSVEEYITSVYGSFTEEDQKLVDIVNNYLENNK